MSQQFQHDGVPLGAGVISHRPSCRMRFSICSQSVGVVPSESRQKEWVRGPCWRWESRLICACIKCVHSLALHLSAGASQQATQTASTRQEHRRAGSKTTITALKTASRMDVDRVCDVFQSSCACGLLQIQVERIRLTHVSTWLCG